MPYHVCFKKKLVNTKLLEALGGLGVKQILLNPFSEGRLPDSGLRAS